MTYTDLFSRIESTVT